MSEHGMRPSLPLPQIETFPLLQADALVTLAEETAIRPDVPLTQARRAAMQGVRFDRNAIKFFIFHPGGSASCKSAYVYRINTQVAAILHRGYIHPGTRCEVDLVSLDGDAVVVRASIVQCRHLAGLIHDSLVEFDDRLNLRRFVKWTPEVASLVAETEKPRPLRGRVLHIEPSASERALFASRLANTQLRLVAVPDAPAAYDETKRTGNWQLIVSELRVGDTVASEVARKLRELGEHAPLLLLTSERGPRRQTVVDDSEASGVLDKPYSPDALLALVSSLLPATVTGNYDMCPSGRVCSTLREGDEARQLVEGYIAECTSHIAELERSAVHDDVPACRALCLWLAGSAEAFGFGVIADHAGQVVTEIDAAGSTLEAQRSLSALLGMLRRLSICGPGGCGAAAT
ncbi:MAG: response regulator [Phycisphaerales bacterium]|nr:response regulator [Phycisphaerales bacterium]